MSALTTAWNLFEDRQADSRHSMSPNDGSSWLRDNALQILDAAVDAIIVIDDAGLIHSINSATLDMFGHEANALIGQPVGKLMPEPYRSGHQRFIQHYLATGDARIIGIGRELVAERADGSTFPISLAISEVGTDGARYFAGVIRDLTEQKAVQQALAEQRERLAQVGRLSTMGEMTASIAHEINQPLTAIAMYAQACQRLLAHEQLDRKKVAEALTKLNQQALRAGAVIERIQRFVRNEDGQRETVDIAQLVQDLMLLVTPDARLHGVQIILELQAGVICLCDPIQIQQVLINLIRNAIDAMYEASLAHGDRIFLSSHQSEGRVFLSVKDSGPGVPESEADRIFDAFHSTKSSGMGMGLSICRSIAKAHDGALRFFNHEGAGCTFELQLPLGVPDE